MKSLSIRQPWALLVCVGARLIENRTWDTPYRGEIAIHAGSYTDAVRDLLDQHPQGEPVRKMVSFGAIIGVTELYDVRQFSKYDWDDPCAEGPYCFLFRNSRLFRTPIPHKGRVNLCKLPAEVVSRVDECKEDCIDVESTKLREQSLQVIPAGKMPQAYLRQQPQWWTPNKEAENSAKN